MRALPITLAIMFGTCALPAYSQAGGRGGNPSVRQVTPKPAIVRPAYPARVPARPNHPRPVPARPASLAATPYPRHCPTPGPSLSIYSDYVVFPGTPYWYAPCRYSPANLEAAALLQARAQYIQSAGQFLIDVEEARRIAMKTEREARDDRLQMKRSREEARAQKAALHRERYAPKPRASADTPEQDNTFIFNGTAGTPTLEGAE